MCDWVISHTVTVLLLAVLALALGRRLRTRPALRHALWLLVLVKFLTPPLVHWPWPLPAVTPGWGKGAETDPPPAGPGMALTSPDRAPGEAVAREAGTPVPRPAGRGGEDAADVAVPALETEPRTTSSWTLLANAALAGWLAGGLVLALVQLVRLARLRDQLARIRAGPAWLELLVRELAGTLGMKPPRVGVLPGLASPLVVGLGHCYLLWPEGLEACLSGEGRRAVLVHELAHLRRRDHWVSWLVLVGGCVWWWHPLFGLVRRQLGRAAEEACDAWVVCTLPETRRDYAEALIEVTQWQSGLAAAVPALGAGGSYRDLERRLIMIARYSATGRLSLRLLLGLVVLAVLALPVWTPGQEKQPAKSSPLPAREAPPNKPVKQQDFSTYILNQNDANNITPFLVDYINQEPASDRDQKLAEVEKKLQALLKEVAALRNGSQNQPDKSWVYTFDQPVVWNLVNQPAPANAARAPEEITLSRKTYPLSSARAQALAGLLAQHVKEQVLEASAHGDSLVVTTTHEAQRVIGQFVDLLQGRTPKPDTGAKPKE